jgi:cytochrome c peroxidase
LLVLRNVVLNFVKFLILAGFLSCALSACGGGGGSTSEASTDPDSNTPVEPESDPSPVEPDPEPVEPSSPAPQNLIGNAFSGTSVGLSWLDSQDTYTVYRDNVQIAQITNPYYVDEDLTVNTTYEYAVSSATLNEAQSTSTVIAQTLLNANNDGLNNGAETVIANDRLLNFSACNLTRNNQTAIDVADADLNACLDEMLQYNSMTSHLENMRAFAARVRSEQTPAKVELGMKLFHNKSLSANNDTACSSCHHPALGCGGDDLSMPIGVNAVAPELLGPGRSDGTNNVPIVPRNSPATCNTALWDRGLFWDNRVSLTMRGVNTDSQDVSDNTQDAVGNGTLALLMAQAHFPVTAAPEMGDASELGYDDSIDSDLTDYREEVLASRITTDIWGDMFTNAFGDNTINYSRIAEAMAAYEAVQIFIDNPFFDYVDGNTSAINNDEKRGAITFMAGSTGCTFCHAGSFFTTQAQLPGNYPQIGVGTSEDGSGADQGADGLDPDGDGPLDAPGAFRAPTLLNVAITGPWGHNGQFATLKRNVEHYTGHGASIAAYFANNEMCDLEQFKDLEDCANQVAPNGLALSNSILDGNDEFSTNISDEEVDLVVQFLETLTDPDAANVNSNAIRALIPQANGGPNGQQLDAVDLNQNAL